MHNSVIASDGEILDIDSSDIALSYTGLGDIETMTVTQAGKTYVKTFTYVGGKVTNISKWVKQ